MKQVGIGDLRHRVTVQQVARVGDGGGGASESWNAVATVWAAVLPLGGREELDGDVLSGALSHEIWMRHRDDVAADMRIVMASRIFEIRSVINVEERGRWLRLVCDEQRL